MFCDFSKDIVRNDYKIKDNFNAVRIIQKIFITSFLFIMYVDVHHDNMYMINDLNEI